MEVEVLLYSFNETVDVLNIDLSKITLQSSPISKAISFTFDTSDLPDKITSNVTIIPSLSDLNNLKKEPVCVSVDTCFISFPSSAITDTSNNDIVEISSNDAQAIYDEDLILDTTRPEFVRFDTLDLDGGFFILTFTETINVTSVNLTEIVIQDSFNVLSSDDLIRLNTEGTFSDEHNDSLNVTFSRDDLNLLKKLVQLCSQPGDFDCWIRFGSNFVKDMAGNSIHPVNDSDSIFDADYDTLPATFIEDTTSPTLEGFSIDMTEGTITFTFDETVNVNTLKAQFLTIQNAISPNTSYQLTAGNLAPGLSPSATFTFSLISLDITKLQANLELATEKNTTFISFTQDLIEDMYTNRVNNMSVLRATNYVGDTLKPSLQAFEILDLNQEYIQLKFSEPMGDDIVFTGLSIRADIDSDISYNLTDGLAVQFFEDRTVVRFTLTDDDVRGLKLEFPNIATEEDNTFIAIAAGSFADTSGNLLNPVYITNAVQVDDHVPDTTNPRLSSFEIGFEHWTAGAHI